VAVQNVKYNPAFLSQDELVRSFVVRQVDLEILLEVIRDNKGQTNQHVLIVGPRGSGKTTLVRRAAAEIHLKEELSSSWYPVIFSEESYEVCSPGEFWLEALFHIGQQTKEVRWKGTYEELRSEKDEARLRERALSQLMDFADEQEKRLLLVVENLNMLLGQQISHDDAWAIRHTLLNEPRLMLIGTATSRFEQLENSDKAMFELFKIHELDPLDTDECRELWASITGRQLGGDRIRPIQILTGGSPRLLVIISAFAAKASFKELMDDLTHLVDEHTEYFKSHIDSFPSLERKVFVTLADLWQPSTARELAEVARIDVNKASSYLKRLLSKGAVVEVDQGGGKKWYQVAERMYNIYHLMRRRGEPSYRIRGVVHFMVHFYHGEDLVRTTAAIASEACSLPADSRIDHYHALQEILKSPQTEHYRDEIFKQLPEPFFRLADLPDAFRRIEGTDRHPQIAEIQQPTKEELLTLRPENPKDPDVWIRMAIALKEQKRLEDAEMALRKAIDIEPNHIGALNELGFLLAVELQRYDEAEQAFRKAIDIDAEYVLSWNNLGNLLRLCLQRYAEAEEAYKKAIKIDPNNAWSWNGLGHLLGDNLQRYAEAEEAYKKAIEIDPNDAWAWNGFGHLLRDNLHRYAEAEEAYKKAIEIDPNDVRSWRHLGHLLRDNLHRYAEAEEAYKKAIEIDPKHKWSWLELGNLLTGNLQEHAEAEEAFRKAVEIDPEFAGGWNNIGNVLVHVKRYTEAEEAYRKGIEIDPDFSMIWSNLIKLHLGVMAAYESAYQSVNQFFEACGRSAENLNNMAWSFFQYAPKDHLNEAETWSREAVQQTPDNPDFQHTLASILGRLGNWDEALEISARFLESKEFLEIGSSAITEFFITAAAAGYGEASLSVLEQHSNRPALEPLIVGIKIFLGKKVRTAQEIMEIGKDVAKRIEERKGKSQKDEKE
jgi:tetratricopeptide (TPR) repeat protein